MGEICDGCNVREPFEHRCHDAGLGAGARCICVECRGADAFMAALTQDAVTDQLAPAQPCPYRPDPATSLSSTAGLQ